MVCVAGLMACALAEVYIRLTKPYETPDTLRAKSLEYEATLFSRHAFPQMVQEKHGTWRGPWSVEINARGYRGKLFAVPKPAGVVRVIVLGGSAAFDAGAGEGEDWPHLANELLWARGYPEVEIINAATPGHATWDVLGRLYAEIWMFEPDYVVVYEAWNDVRYFTRLGPNRSLLRDYRPAQVAMDGSLVDNQFMYYTGPMDRLLSHSQLYTRLRWRYQSWQVGIIGLEGVIRLRGGALDTLNRHTYPDDYGPYGPRQYALNLRLIADAAQYIGAKPLFFTQARLVSLSNDELDREKIGYELVKLSHEALVRALTDCDKAIFAIAKAKDVPVLDLSGLFTGQSGLFYDHVHTTPAGSHAIAKAVADFLQQLLDQGRAIASAPK
jgi:lysophospholipase L1-like esterase